MFFLVVLLKLFAFLSYGFNFQLFNFFSIGVEFHLVIFRYIVEISQVVNLFQLNFRMNPGTEGPSEEPMEYLKNKVVFLGEQNGLS